MFFHYFHCFFSHVPPTSVSTRRRRGRMCRVEELESRELLDAGLTSAFADVFTHCDEAAFNTGELTFPAITGSPLAHAENEPVRSSPFLETTAPETTDSETTDPKTTDTETPPPVTIPAADPVKPHVSKFSTISTIVLMFDTKWKSGNSKYDVTCITLPNAMITVTDDRAVIEGLQPRKFYKFSIVAKNADDKSAPAVFVTVKTKKYPPVRGIEATAGLNSVMLNWNPATVPETTGYIIHVYERAGNTLVQTISIEGKDTTAQKIENLKQATRYSFVIYAISNSLGNILSTISKVRVSTVKYVHVRSLEVTEKTDTTVTLTWTASRVAETSGYEIVNAYTGTAVAFDWMPHPSLSGKIIAVVRDLTPSTKYTFIVRAVANVGGNKFVSRYAKISVKTAAPAMPT